MMHRSQSPILLLLFLCLCAPLWSQTENAPSPTLETPYNCMHVHLYYLQTNTYQPEIAGQTFYQIADSVERRQKAIKLKQILDGNGLYVHLNLLPQQADYIDSLTNKPYYTPFPDELPQVYLERIDERWYYSRETAQLIPELHKKIYPFGTDILLNLLPKLGQQHIMGLAIWQYIGILILLLLSWIAHKLLSRILYPIIRRLARSRYTELMEDKAPIYKIARVFSMLLISLLIRLLIPILQLPIGLAEFSITGIRIMITCFTVLLVLRILDLVMIYASSYAQSTEHKMDEQLLPIVRRMLYIIFIIGGIIQILRLLDVNVTALVAGISIGGLALALAAQDTVKNLLGSAMIFIDKPFQIGDFIEGSGFVGTVKEVGFRTTRITATDTSIISVPNGSIANMSIKNLGMRVYRVFSTELGITYNTPPERIEAFVSGLKRMILSHPKTLKRDYYVYLNSMQASSLNIFFRVMLEVDGYATELKVKEDLILGMLRLASEMDISYAFPSSSVYIEEFPGKLPNKSVRAESAEELERKVSNFLDQFTERHREA
ncbi:MAG: mechanosensitive ion channel family protein [Bacteroidota bacterium]